MKLPNRRMNISEEILWRDQRYHITVGFSADGSARELFITGPKVGSDNEASLQDACVLVSKALQVGADIEALAGSMGREHTDPGAPIEGVGRAASVLGMVVNLVAKIQNDEGLKIKCLHDLIASIQALSAARAEAG